MTARTWLQQPTRDSVQLAQRAELLRTILREYVVAQERYFSANKSYAERAQEVGVDLPAGVVLNVVSASGTGHIHAEVPGVDGYGLEDSVPISGDNVEAEVRWKHGVAVGCRAEERRVLRLHLEEATVYAFEFRPVAQSGPA
jgi:hypothetical protein